MAEQRVQRKLAAILAADVVGYSRLMEADESGTLDRLKALRSELFEPKTREYGGRIFKTTGDGALVEFKSAVDAVNSAVEIQRALVEREVGIAEARRIRLRIGISLGDVIVEGSDLYGNGVNVAARMEGLAEPDGICVSANVHEHVQTTMDLAFDDLGEQKVKNLDRPVRCFRVREGGQAVGAAVTPGWARAEAPGIAVLPFANMSGDPDQEYFSDGMVEEIITGLARIRWLTVIARNSTFAYKGKAPDVRQVGRDLAVRYVLEGSVRKAGDRVRITAQLIDAETGGHLWADRFDGVLADVFDLQDEITGGVVAAIEPSVRRAEIERAKRKRPDNLGAYDLYLRALEHAYTYSPEGRAAALDLLLSALRLDPDYTEAHGVAAFCLTQRYLWQGRTAADKESALAHAESVAVAQTDDATALAFAAFVMSALTTNYERALAMVDRALVQTPSSAFAHTAKAAIELIRGDREMSQKHAEQSLRLSPFDPMRYFPEMAIASAKLMLGDVNGALERIRRALEANPVLPPALTVLALCLVRLGRIEEARVTVEKLREVSPDTRVATLQERFLYSNILGFNDIVADLRSAGLPD